MESRKPRLVMVLCAVLPLAAVGSAEFYNATGSNGMMYLVIAGVLALPVLVWRGLVPSRWYGWVIWIAALSLLWHRSWASPFLWGTDIVDEYAVYVHTFYHGWEPSAPGLIPAYNATWSVTVFPALLSRFTGLGGRVIFKLVFPFFLSLVPVLMYSVVARQFGKRLAFYSTFLVLSLYTYYGTYLTTAKQTMAVFWLMVLVLVLLQDWAFWKGQLAVLGAGVALALSHYATAFLVVGLLWIVWAGSRLLRRQSTLGVAATMAVTAFTGLWYWNVADGVVIKQFLGMGVDAVGGGAPTGASVPPAGYYADVPVLSAGYYNEAVRLMVEGSPSLTPEVRVLYGIVGVLVTIGFAWLAWRWWRGRARRLRVEFLLLTAGCGALMAGELLLPKVAEVLSLDRVVVLCMLFFAPFAVWVIWRLVPRRKVFHLAMTAFLVVFLVANTGVARGHYMDLDYQGVPTVSAYEYEAIRWALANVPPGQLYGDDLVPFQFRNILVTEGMAVGYDFARQLHVRRGTRVVAEEVPAGSCIFMRRHNLRTGTLLLGWPLYQTMERRFVSFEDLGEFGAVLRTARTVFQNDSCRIVRTTEDYWP